LSTKDIATNEWPAEVRGLPSDGERRFVLAYVENGGVGSQAARDAGYSGSTVQSQASIAYRLLKRERIHDAILAYSKRYLRSLVPTAVNTVKEILEDPTHKDRLKAAREIIDRTDAKISQVNVDHTIHLDPQRDSLEWLKHLKAIDAPRVLLIQEFGEFGLEHYEKLLAKATANVIEGEFIEIEGPPAQDVECLDL
jgi:phage terminase small subunit